MATLPVSTLTALTTTLSKRVDISCSHYYWVDAWTPEENQRRFGLCANRHGHGHNYRIDISIQGPIDPISGFVINFFDLHPLMNAAIVQPLDHKNLNAEVATFKSRLPNLEGISQFIWASMQSQLTLALGDSSPLQLMGVRVYETDWLWVDYDGAMLTLTRQYQFSAAHRLVVESLSEQENQRLFGPCARLHGHNYTLEVSVTGPQDPECGMVMDLVTLDALVTARILSKVDHICLDTDVDFLVNMLSTVERVGQAIFDELAPHIPSPARLTRIRLAESATNWVDISHPSSPSPSPEALVPA